MSSSALMPAAFIGHGSPMNTLERNRYTAVWRDFGRSVPRPRAILVVSAHWYINATAVTAMARPRTIHDFYGFPQALFDVQYPAPGLPELADEVAEIARPEYVGADHGSWGLDHGTWSVLVHAFPDAEVPVVQLSINAQRRLEDHVELGARLAALRARGVLVVASGNVVHNLHAIDWKRQDAGFDWAHRFDDAARELMMRRPGDAARLREHADYSRAVPTDEHFIPMLYIAGLAAGSGVRPEVLVDGYAYGSLSMTCYGVDVPRPPERDDLGGAAAIASEAPPEETNI